jgi:uncharacterized membrane protein
MLKKKVFSFLPKKFKAKYSIDEKVPSSGVYECSICENYTAFKKGEIFNRCDDCKNEGKEDIGQWYVTNEVVHFMSKNLNIEFEKLETFQLRLADKITELAGTMGFVYFHVIWFTLWIGMNEEWFGKTYVFDMYPYGLLTMIVSLEAIILATFIMISQNIMSKQAELRAELDYQVNLKTEKEVAEILIMLKELKEQYTMSTAIEAVIEKESKTKKGKKKKKKTEDMELEEEETLLKEAGIYMMKDPGEQEND